MKIENNWNGLSYNQKLTLIERQLEVTRDIKNIAKLNWNELYSVEKRQISLIYTHKEFNISFKVKCNETGVNEIKREFHKFLESKDWNYKDLKINY